MRAERDLCHKVNQERPQAGAAAVQSVFRDEKMLLIFNYIQYIHYILYNAVIVALLQVNTPSIYCSKGPTPPISMFPGT